MDQNKLSLEQRVAELENSLILIQAPTHLKNPALVTSLLASLAAIGFSINGLGTPNHLYQVVLSGLIVFIAYHRGWLLRPASFLQYLMGLLNWAQLCLLLKLFVGTGKRLPLFWLQYPQILSPTPQKKWYQILPELSLSWQPTPLANWELDLTVVQTFLLLTTLLGAFFRFQPFTSLTALCLILVSIPAFVGFNWSWVFPAVAASGLAFYLQILKRASPCRFCH